MLDVVRGLRLLNELHLAHEGEELVGHVLPRDLPGLPDQLRGFFAPVGAEVGEKPATHADGLAYVQHFVIPSDHAVYAGPVLGVASYVVAEGAVFGHGRSRGGKAGQLDFRFLFG